ncbi:ion channel [Halovivax limisalsi]|uniref:ion channel n=1 Tax=Halovivax limisalsi TaxID=1453760 RepID=UPI001FFDD6F6|nr:ion channel [Halovivax limisalsi]
MTVGFLALGIALLAVAVVDILWTTLWVEGGAGPLTSRLMEWIWWALRRFSRRSSLVRTLAGPVILVASLATWMALLWLGWTFVFAAGEVPLVDTVGGGSLTWSDRFYVAGYALFSLGNGDFAPSSSRWQFVTVLATASGLSLITLAVTYVLSVLDAVTQKRSFAAGVAGLGSTGAEVVTTAWDGESFEGLDQLLSTYVQQLNALSTNHKAYPVLHYFHTQDRSEAPVTSAAILDDALTLLRFGVRSSERPGDAIVANARASIASYLDTLGSRFVGPANRTPPPPDIDAVREAKIPTRTDDEFAESVDELETRRRLLLGLVEADAREWPGEGE